MSSSFKRDDLENSTDPANGLSCPKYGGEPIPEISEKADVDENMLSAGSGSEEKGVFPDKESTEFSLMSNWRFKKDKQDASPTSVPTLFSTVTYQMDGVSVTLIGISR